MSKCENMFGRAIVFLCECSWCWMFLCVRIVFLDYVELDFILKRFVDLNLWFGPLRGTNSVVPFRPTSSYIVLLAAMAGKRTVKSHRFSFINSI